MLNNDVTEWEKMVSSIEGCVGVQLSKKVVNEKDGVERDEGIWLFSINERVDSRKTFFKDLGLNDRIKIVSSAKKQSIFLFKELISKLQKDEIPGTLDNSKYWISAIEEMDSDESEDGMLFVFGKALSGYGGSLLDLENAEWETQNKKSKITIIQKSLRLTSDRYDKAIKKLKDLEYITSNHDYR